MIKFLLFAPFIFAAQISWAQNRSGTKPLFFPAAKNNLQILPQRFEYNLLNDSQLRLGDILIDSSKITLSIDEDVQKGYQRAQFSWPSGLISEGEIAIKNNSGIAIFSLKVNQKKMRAQGTGSSDEENPTRDDIGTYSTEIPATLFEDMKLIPFVKFCIFRETHGTRLYLCSEELALQKHGDSWTIRPRITRKKQAQISINGKVVGNQGLIYLNKRDEDIAFIAEMASGATLEVETRKKDVDFKDVTESEDGKRVTLSAAGAEPVDPKKIRRLSDNEWQISLSKARPRVYLKGDGDIPLRQEFDILGALPKAKLRPLLTANASPRTYSSQVEMTVISPSGAPLSVAESDGRATLEPSSSGDNQSLWTISQLEANRTVRHFLKVDAGGNSFLAAYDIYRGQPYFIEASLLYNAPSGIALGSLELQWWFENLLGINSNVTKFHWGLSLERNQHFTTNDDYPELDFNNLEILWRATEGLHFVDSSWGLSLPVQMIQGDGFSATAYGLGFFWLTPPPLSGFAKFIAWNEFKFSYLFGSTGDDFKLNSGTLFSAKAYSNLSDSFYLSYGLSLTGYKFEPASVKEDFQAGLQIGAAWKF